MCALRWSHLDLDAGVMKIERNYVWGRAKDPKSHQMRRVSIDAATVDLLRHSACGMHSPIDYEQALRIAAEPEARTAA
jgi:integrase